MTLYNRIFLIIPIYLIFTHNCSFFLHRHDGNENVNKIFLKVAFSVIYHHILFFSTIIVRVSLKPADKASNIGLIPDITEMRTILWDVKLLDVIAEIKYCCYAVTF